MAAAVQSGRSLLSFQIDLYPFPFTPTMKPRKDIDSGTAPKEASDRKESAALSKRGSANPPAEASRQASSSSRFSVTLASDNVNMDDAKLPPSPLVTPPMGSNPSRTASATMSPRELLPSPDAASMGASAASAAASPNAAEDEKRQQRGIPHIYHDYSSLSGPGQAYLKKKTGGVTQPFPEKLHEMLSQESNDDPAVALVSWLPHGRAFIVRRPKEFTTEIMPKYFRQTKLTSFQRQLNLYGFRRITQGADSGAYYHPLFLQGRPSLGQRMVRQKVKGTGHKQPSDASSEPNFYTMPPVEPEYPVHSAWGARYNPASLPSMPVPTLPGAAASNLVNGIDPYSPGVSSLRGAAQLLHGIAAAGAFLGPPAAAAPATQSALPKTPRKPVSFLQPDQLKKGTKQA